MMYPDTSKFSSITIWNAQSFANMGTLPLAENVFSFSNLYISDNMLYIAAQADSRVFTWNRKSIADNFT